MTGSEPRCRCGCGSPVRPGRNFARGHRRPVDPIDRVMAWVKITETGCWEWQRARNNHGYGRLCVAPGDYRLTHRWMYELKNGSIPDGMVLDHLCRNRPCCNPDHLEPVTPLVNAHRGQAPMMMLRQAGVCKRGHPASDAYRRPGTDRVVRCRACLRELRASGGQS